MEDLILYHQLSDNEIAEFYHELYDRTDKGSFRLLNLYSDDLEEILSFLQEI